MSKTLARNAMVKVYSQSNRKRRYIFQDSSRIKKNFCTSMKATNQYTNFKMESMEI